MDMNLSDYNYFPTMSVRSSEMRALTETDKTTQERFLPIILLAPWQNTKTFEKTKQKIDNARKGLPRIIDIDYSYRSSANNEAQDRFEIIKSGRDSYGDWIDFILSQSNQHPVIQVGHESTENSALQIQEFSDLNYGFRYDLDRPVPGEIMKQCLAMSSNRFSFFIIDGGWSRSPELLAARISQTIRYFYEYIQNKTVIISSSSFPNDFTDIEGVENVHIGARNVFSMVQAQFNSLSFKYSDWASTKPRNYDGFGSKPRPRIDVANKFVWHISRNEQGDDDYVKAAKRIINLPEWNSIPDSWGKYVIQKTANDEPGGILSHQKAIAARINLHLFAQTYFQEEAAEISNDEAWEDVI